MKTYLLLAIILFPTLLFAQEKKDSSDLVGPSLLSSSKVKERVKKHFYGYKEKEHTLKEDIGNLAVVYGITWVLYPITQPNVFSETGSLDKYKDNFGKIVFDQDEPFWNWMVHPFSGSQLYLWYRAHGYSRIDSLTMSAISSTLFEFTVEIYSEPASIQDLYQTPILGAVLGVGLEKFSMYLLNTGNAMGIFFGHLLNFGTLFPFYEGKIIISPQLDTKGNTGLSLYMTF